MLDGPVIEHRCSMAAQGGCSKPRKSGPVLYVLPGGARVCAFHARDYLRESTQRSCSHSLAPSGRCSYCGLSLTQA